MDTLNHLLLDSRGHISFLSLSLIRFCFYETNRHLHIYFYILHITAVISQTISFTNICMSSLFQPLIYPHSLMSSLVLFVDLCRDVHCQIFIPCVEFMGPSCAGPRIYQLFLFELPLKSNLWSD